MQLTAHSELKTENVFMLPVAVAFVVIVVVLCGFLLLFLDGSYMALVRGGRPEAQSPSNTKATETQLNP